LNLLKQTVLFTEDDEISRKAGEVLADQIDAILDTWYSFVGSHLIWRNTSALQTIN